MSSGPAAWVDRACYQYLFYRDASTVAPGIQNNDLLHKFSTNKGKTWKVGGPHLQIQLATVQEGTSPAVVFAPINTSSGGPLLHDRIIVAFMFNTQRADEGVLSVVYGQHT